MEDKEWVRDYITVINIITSFSYFNMKIRLYSATEIKDLLTNVGFTSINIYGDLIKSEYDDKAKRLIVIGKNKNFHY